MKANKDAIRSLLSLGECKSQIPDNGGEQIFVARLARHSQKC